MDISSQENLLTELESNLVMASSGQRFLNYIIDFIVFYIFILGLGLVLGLVFPAALEG
jgi:hypothetical protein